MAPAPIYFKQVHVFPGSHVLYIGDSHTLMSGAHRTFHDCDVDARSGRTSTEGLSVLDRCLRPEHEVVVFDLATNDHDNPAHFEANLELLDDRVGPRKLIMVNCWRQDRVNSHRGVNGVLTGFVARHHDRAALVDWAAYIDGHPASLGRDTDWVHFTIEAYRARAGLVRAAIRSSLEVAE